ncbi:MAG: 50S ribosomal protein L33 [Candidatus Levyibacteriota bacterium]
MAKKKTGAVLKVGLVCTVCKTRGYITSRNKLNTPEKLNLNKFCRKCKKVQPHKEVEKLK